MDVSTARKATTFTIVGVFGIGMAKSIMVDNQFPPIRFFFATGLVAFGLGVASDLSPQLAGSLSLLVFTVVLLEEGPPLFRKLTDRDIPKVALPPEGEIESLFAGAVPLEPTIPSDLSAIDIKVDRAVPLVTQPPMTLRKPRVRRKPRRTFPLGENRRIRANP